MMIGVGTLFRMLKRLLGKPLENTGALPTRYYLHEVLNSLDRDNIGEAVKLLKLSKGALIDKSRWEMVRQQIIFRCRVLTQRHRNRIRLLEAKIEAHKKRGTLPWQWFRKRPAEKLLHYEKTLALEKQAQDLLEQYESELKDILTHFTSFLPQTSGSSCGGLFSRVNTRDIQEPHRLTFQKP